MCNTYDKFNFFFVDNSLLQADLHKVDALGREAVHHVCMAGAVSTLQYLIEEGVDVTKPAGVGLATPLHYAAKVSTLNTPLPGLVLGWERLTDH